MLRRFYDWMMSYSAHPRANWVLAGVSFTESSFFPLPPDPLYLAMLMAALIDPGRGHDPTQCVRVVYEVLPQRLARPEVQFPGDVPDLRAG